MELDQLDLPSGAGFVKMRRKILWGDEQAVESAVFAAVRAGSGQGVHAFKRQRIFQLIEGWSLYLHADATVGAPDSPTAAPLPMEVESLDRLEPQDGDFLYEYAAHRFDKREDVANPFVPGTEPPSPEDAQPA